MELPKEIDYSKKYKQVRPFTFGKMFDGEVFIRQLGYTTIQFFSVTTGLSLGTSDISTLELFEEVSI